jgi:glycosyltransferase involved in cell wall biosynthesis
MNVVISGLIFPLTIMRYFWEAFEHRENVELIVTGPFSGSWIPWRGGMELPQRYVKHPDIPLPKTTASMRPDPKIVEIQLPWKPDLWIQFDAGFHFSRRPDARVVALVETDPHCLKPHYKLPKSYSDFTFSMQLVYSEPGEHYLPYAYSKYHHFHEDLQKKYDACMIGLQYEQRTRLINKLVSRNKKVFYDIGVVFDEYRRVYNASKIGLNWSSLLDLNARCFELLAMGSCAVMNRVPDLPTFFTDGEHYVGFDDMDEAETKILQLLEDDDMREEISSAGHRKVQFHTYDARVQQMLEIMKMV